jgi:DNA-binding IclR family transcriptional regulator
MGNAEAIDSAPRHGPRKEPGTSAVQSVDRAIAVLEILASRGEAGVSEVATEIDVHKSTAFRLLSALEDRGLVEQVEDRGKYRLGFGIVRLAGAVADRLDVTRLGRPVCERLASEIGETANLAVRQSHYAVNLYEARGPASVATHNWVGQLTPLHCTSSGKVLLAYLPAEERTQLLSEAGLPPLTGNTITLGAALEEDLRLARSRGYAVAIEEYEVGLNAVAAPIRGREGVVMAAVSASGPAYRFAPDRMHELAPVLLAGAADISRGLGFVD